MAKTDGMGAIRGEISAAAAAAAPLEEQLDLMPATRFEPGSDQHNTIVAAVKRDRAGRPPGARNKATREMLDFVRSTYGDPLIRRFSYLNHTPETLALELGCSKAEAYDRLDRLWADLARFFYATQAQVDGQGNAVVPRLTMQIGVHGGGVAGVVAPGQPPWMYLAEMQQNQALPQPAEPVSHGAVSHDGEK